MQSEWAELLALIPEASTRKLAAVADVSANVRADRAAYGSPPPVATPDLPPCPVKPAATDHTMTHVLVGLMLISLGVCFYFGYAAGQPKANGKAVAPSAAPAPAAGAQG